MSLDLGTLTGFLELDESKFSGVLDMLPDKMSGAGVLMGAAAGAVALGVGAALADGIMAGFEADRLNAALSASLNLSEEQSARAGEVAGSLYAAAYGESMEEVSGAIEGVISSIDGMGDASAEELESITANVMDMSAAFGVESDRISQVVGQMLSTGLVSSAQEGVDLLTATLQSVPTAVREDILDATSEYGTYFSALGLSGQEGMALLASASDGGAIAIDKIGDALKELTIRATDGSAASGAAYEAMGMSAEDMSNRILAGGDSANAAFAEIVAGLQGIQDPTEQANAAIALFGTPLEDLGTGAIPDFLGSLSSMEGGLGDVAGAADEMGATLNDNAATSWEQMSRTWDSIVGQVGGALVPVLMEVTTWLNENPVAMQIAAAVLGVLALAFVGVSVATWAMNTALLASPITWIILGIVALIAAIVLLVMNWDTVVAWITEVWDGFIGWITEVMDGFVAWWNELWAGFASWVTEVWNGFVGWLQGIWDGFVGWLTDSGNAIAAWWNGLWAGIGAWVQGVWQGFINWIISLFLGYVTWLYGIGSGIVSWWNGLWSGIGAFIQNTWNALVAFVMGVFQGYVNWLRGVGGQISSWWNGLWSGVRSGVEGAWNGIISWLQGIPGAIQGVFSGAVNWLRQIGRNVIDGLMGGLQAGWDRVVGWINGLGGGIIDTFASILGIHSPSRVFRAFGLNIMQGLDLGLQDGQGFVDDRMGSLVTVPTATESELFARAGIYSTGSGYRDAEGRSIHIDVHGNVGYDPEEFAMELMRAERERLALLDVDEFSGVA